MQQLPYIVLLLIATSIAVYLARHVARRRAAPGAQALLVLVLAAAEWSAAYALELAATDLETKLFWVKVEYLGIVSVAPAWFLFAIQYSDRMRWLAHSRRNQALLAIMPVLTLIFVWSNDAHGLIWSRTGLDASGPLLLLDVDYGLWSRLHSTYSYVLMLLGSIWFAVMLRRSAHLYRWQAGMALLGMLAPWVANALFLSRLGPVPGLDLTPIGFGLAGLAYAWSLFHLHFMEIVPIARRAVVDGLGDGVIVLDLQNRIVDLNPVAQRLVGSTDVGLIGHPVTRVLSACADLVERCGDQNVVQAEMTFGDEPAQQHYELRISPLTNRRDHGIGRLIVLHNITDRKHVEEKLYQAKDELEIRVAERTAELQQANEQLRTELAKRQQAEAALRNLARHLELIREEEKTRIARQVHDELGQMLTALKMDVAWLSSRLPKENDPLRQKARAMSELISTTIQSVQRISAELRPGLLDDLGLVAALEWQSHEFQQRTDIDCRLDLVDEAGLELAPDLKTALFRIFQEMLTNVARHAQATAVTISLVRPDHQLRLIVKDNGKGITPAQISDPKSLGLIGIRERLHPWHGELQIESSPGAGTTVSVTVPL